MPHKALSFMDNFYLSVLVLRVSYLRCLIYKVHTALSGGSLSYHTIFVLSRTFFRFFNLFCPFRRPGGPLPILLAASAGDSLIVALLFRSVKNFFQEFFSPFSFSHSELIFGSVPSAVGQLGYVITPVLDCQALFETFFSFLSGHSFPALKSRSACLLSHFLI